MNFSNPYFGCAIALVTGFLFGSYVEYAVHRLMHLGKFDAQTPRPPPQEFLGPGLVGELTDYSLPGLLVAWAGFLVSVPAGLGFAVGILGYAAFAAYAHQSQHQKPDLAFWLGAPIHYIHHRDNMWHHNFGIGVSLWDRLLGTYKPAEWQPQRPLRQYPIREFVTIRWR